MKEYSDSTNIIKMIDLIFLSTSAAHLSVIIIELWLPKICGPE